jgi:hypothetical protein
MDKSEFNSDTPVPDTRVRTVSKGVNLKTMEGARKTFDSMDEMEAYMLALIAEDYDDEI